MTAVSGADGGTGVVLLTARGATAMLQPQPEPEPELEPELSVARSTLPVLGVPGGLYVGGEAPQSDENDADVRMESTIFRPSLWVYFWLNLALFWL